MSFFQGEVWLIILIRGSGEELHEWHTMNELEREIKEEGKSLPTEGFNGGLYPPICILPS